MKEVCGEFIELYWGIACVGIVDCNLSNIWEAFSELWMHANFAKY